MNTEKKDWRAEYDLLLARTNQVIKQLQEDNVFLAAKVAAQGFVGPPGWQDAQTYDDLYACGIRGFLDINNRDKPEAEVVAAVKDAMAAMERGEFTEAAFIGDDLPPLPEPYRMGPNRDELRWNEADMRKFARDTLNRYAKHFKSTPPPPVAGEDRRDALCKPIERDEQMDRTYIPMPGGWEIQTKGKGSTFRICGPDDDRLAIPDSPYLHETLEQMARDVNAAALAAMRGEGNG
jgi:hypothetical protein